MGRAFEYRKATKLKRWGNMARVFTKLGKQITIAVREGGPDPDGNPRLRVLMQQAKKENMPKENVERAIKKATSKEEGDYKEVVIYSHDSADGNYVSDILQIRLETVDLSDSDQQPAKLEEPLTVFIRPKGE